MYKINKITAILYFLLVSMTGSSQVETSIKDIQQYPDNSITVEVDGQIQAYSPLSGYIIADGPGQYNSLEVRSMNNNFSIGQHIEVTGTVFDDIAVGTVLYATDIELLNPEPVDVFSPVFLNIYELDETYEDVLVAFAEVSVTDRIPNTFFYYVTDGRYSTLKIIIFDDIDIGDRLGLLGRYSPTEDLFYVTNAIRLGQPTSVEPVNYETDVFYYDILGRPFIPTDSVNIGIKMNR